MNERWFDRLPSFVFASLAIALGFHSLADVDLGWHLVGGLWMLENGRLPSADPLTTTAHFWWCYSWLFELIIASIYRLAEFRGLFVLQGLLIVLYSVAVVRLLRSLEDQPRRSLRSEGCKFLCLGLLLLLSFPAWHLRPQLLSLLFFVESLRRLEGKDWRIVPLFFLEVLWANVHVYWVLLPLTYFLYRISPALLRLQKPERSALFGCVLLSLAGLVTPYGFSAYTGLFAYAFEHGQAYRLIQEFQPLQFRHGMMVFMFLSMQLAAVVLLLRQKQWISVGLSSLYVLFSFAAAIQVKYMPVFGVVAGVFLFRLLSSYMENGERIQPSADSRKNMMATSLLLILILAMPASTLPSERILTEKYADLLAFVPLVRKSIAHEEQKNVRVLNHFDDGGWLALAFWLEKSAVEKDSLWKTTIDGRTLVMGEKRLQEFASLQHLRSDWQSVVHEWNPDVAILPKKAKLATALSLLPEEWTSLTTSEYFWAFRHQTRKETAAVLP